MTDERNHWRVRHRAKVSEAQPGDEQVGGWPRDRLLQMNERFREALETAVASGREHCDTVGACSHSPTPRSP